MIKIIRSTTIPASLYAFCDGLLRKLSMKYDVIALSSPGKELSMVADREGVRVIAVPMERHISLKKDLKSLVALIKVLRKEKPDMVHSMTPKAGLLCMVAAWVTRVPIRVHTFTGLVFPTSVGIKKKVLMFTDWMTCSCATHIIPEGEGVKNDLINNHITKKNMKVLGHGNVKGVDMTRFSRRAEVLQKANKIKNETLFTFLFVGRIVRDKGVNELCEAFERLNSKYKNIQLFLVGDYEDNLDPISTESRFLINNSEYIRSVGPQCDDDLVAYYAASDCYVFPSYREGFPNSVIEAGAMGLPCIVTDINGSREIIIEGRNGTIIPPKDTDALYKSMERMLMDYSWRSCMKQNARQMIMDRFEQSFVQNCLLEFYDEILTQLCENISSKDC